jgi:hypothetical protein
MDLESRIHTFEILKKEEMMFMYAPGAKANPPKIQTSYQSLIAFTASFEPPWLLRLEMQPLVLYTRATSSSTMLRRSPSLSLTISWLRFSTYSTRGMEHSSYGRQVGLSQRGIDIGSLCSLAARIRHRQGRASVEVAQGTLWAA